jgi:hypothetical protein
MFFIVSIFMQCSKIHCCTLKHAFLLKSDIINCETFSVVPSVNQMQPLKCAVPQCSQKDGLVPQLWLGGMLVLLACPSDDVILAQPACPLWPVL